MNLVIGTWDAAWGHTWVSRGFGKLYALKSLAVGSSLVVMDRTGEPLGEYPTPGAHPCHITLLDKEAVVSDYTSGTLSLFPLDSDGLPTAVPQILHFHGKGPHPVRQTSPHVHSSWISADGNSLVVADLGTDQLYRFSVREGRLDKDSRETFTLPAGCGPRHCAFGSGKLYVVTELSDEILVLDWPSMQLMQRCFVNDEHHGGGGHVLLSPDGRYLYASSRLINDGIAVFRVVKDGLLERCGYYPTGSHPRHFCLSADGSLVFVACRDDDVVQIFERNAADGSISDAKYEISVEKPVFIDTYA